MSRVRSLCIALAIFGGANAFHTPSRLQLTSIHNNDGGKRGVLIASPSSTSYRRDVSVGLFRDLLRKVKDRGDNSGDDNDEGTDGEQIASAAEQQEKEEELATPFFASDFLETRSSAAEESTEAETETGIVADEPVQQQQPLAPTPEPPIVVQVKTPEQEAEQLRAQAARIRLEAEKRQVELTLEKIEKLNSQLELLKSQENVDPKNQKSLEEELLRLKSQLITTEKGEIKSVETPPPVASETSKSAVVESEADAPLQAEPVKVSRSILSSELLEERVQKFNQAPEFMKILVAKIAGFGVDESAPGAANRLNATDIIIKLYDDNIDYENIIRTSDFTDESEREKAREMLERAYEQSADNADKPKFTQEQIQAKIEELDQIPSFLKAIYSKDFNDTEMALMLLEEDYNEKNKKGGGLFGMFGNNEKGEIGEDGERMDVQNSGSFSRLFSPEDALNGTSADKKGADLPYMIESLYPKSTRKENGEPDKRLVDAFMNDVVASTNVFIPNGAPIAVPGGYVSIDCPIVFVYYNVLFLTDASNNALADCSRRKQMQFRRGAN